MPDPRPRRPRRALALVAALAVGVGATASPALAQSAGDRQYVDPLATPEPQQQQQQPEARDDSGAGGAPEGDGGGETGGGEVTPAPDTIRAAPVESLDEAIPAESGESATTAGTLPHTGVDGGALAAVGAGLLATGALLRRRTARPGRARP